MNEYTKNQIEMLRRDGYSDAARIIEQQDSSFNLTHEMAHLMDFAAINDSGDLLAREQLRALWTPPRMTAPYLPSGNGWKMKGRHEASRISMTLTTLCAVCWFEIRL